MVLHVLGPLELRNGDVEVPVRRGRPRRLLLGLLLREGDAVATDTLIEELWRDDPPQNAANALQILVSYLRKVLAEAPGTAQIETVDGGYRLVVVDGAVDRDRFEAAIAGADSDDPASRLSALEDALELWRGAPYAELTFDDHAQGDIARMHELRATGLERRIDALLDLGRDDDAVGDLQQLVAEHPLRERFHGQLMLALYRTGRQAEALRAFDTARAVLVEELGLEPGPDLRDLQQAILEQRPELGARTHPSSSWSSASDDLIGRAADVTKLRDLLAARRSITLTGPGGAGKTRLAAEVVAGRAPTWWIDLSPLDDLDGVLGALAGATGAPSPADDTAGDALISHLDGQRGVLVLDTCEHVVDVIRPLVQRLLANTDVVVLATSRRPLRVHDELPWPVPPLGLPDPDDLSLERISASSAVELFRRRAEAVDPTFLLDDRNAADVARICLLLDGLPLALELAAAQARVLSPATIVRLLDDRLKLPGSEDGPARQQTLRATIDWSHERLTADEATFFRRLAVFAGPFTLEAAVTLAGAGIDADGLGLLLGLVNQSLVSVTGADRYRLLDTIRAYATAQLEPLEGAAVRADHARWYAAFAEEADQQLRGGDTAGWMAELRSELPNLRAALVWSFGPDGDSQLGARLAGDLSWFWAVEGLFREAARWLARASAEVEPGSALEARILAERGMHASSLGDLESANADCQRAADLYDELGQPAGVAKSLIYVGVASWGLGLLDAAAEAQERSIKIFRDAKSDWGLAISLVLRARTAADRGEPDVAAMLDAALPVARRAGDDHVIAMCLEQRARQALADGDPALAIDLATESIARHDRVGYAEGTVASMHALGSAHVALGALDEAEVLHRSALRKALELEHPGGMAEGIEALATVADARGDHDTSLRLLSAAALVREERSVPCPPSRRRLVDEVRDRAIASLDPAAARRATTAGRLLDPASLVDGP